VLAGAWVDVSDQRWCGAGASEIPRPRDDRFRPGIGVGCGNVMRVRVTWPPWVGGRFGAVVRAGCTSRSSSGELAQVQRLDGTHRLASSDREVRERSVANQRFIHGRSLHVFPAQVDKRSGMGACGSDQRKAWGLEWSKRGGGCVKIDWRN
jgi:hypothetical protein